ncbi:Septum site-determining protein MinC [hydrothermal vent metagenome]|uniref:Septum site-determining protein MinC n=1 Tax=hydrothermal vent metagenome TaxID=652676 RepID=A0A3B0X9Q7_9ZZZZ
MTDACLQLKGSVITTFILELYRYSTREFSHQLQNRISQAPDFFENSSVVISLDKVDESVEDIDLEELLQLCRQFGLQPMAFRCTDSRFLASISVTGLTLLTHSPSRAATKEPAPPVAIAAKNTAIKEAIPPRKSRIITRPVRSGQQIYAEGSDLIILSQVGAGAEVLADGHIHVYGHLRGRALAGVKGDTDARVFCNKMQAELISIAGNFLLSDALREKVWMQPAQIYLDEQRLHVEAL